MKIPENAIIPDTKLTKYLLIFKQKNDKSKYLLQGGFTLENWIELKTAIETLIKENDAQKDISDQYGTYYQVRGDLKGINKKNLAFVTILLQKKIDNQYYFITLKPDRSLTP